MHTETTSIQSEHAAKYLVTLCRHFARKVPATWSDTEGSVEFPVGSTTMRFDEGSSSLVIVCQSEDSEKLQMQKSIIASHVEMFSRREPIELTWQPV